MRLSAFSIVEENGTGPERDRYREVLELAASADRLGLDAMWVAEHHFQPGGLCPAPAVLLAAIAARTRRLRLGSLVSVLPFHEPVETAEQYALVDRLSGGRLNFGVGSGYVPAELEGYGLDIESKRLRFDRALETILHAWAGRPVRTERERSEPVTLNVRPSRLPPVWIAVQRREAVRFVAARGFSIALIPYATVSDLNELAEEVREFRADLPAGRAAEVSAAFHIYAGEDARTGVSALQRYLDTRQRTGSIHYQEKVRRDPRLANAHALVRSGLAYAGSRDSPDLADWLSRVAATGVDELLGIFDFGGLPVPDGVRSMEAALRALGSPSRAAAPPSLGMGGARP